MNASIFAACARSCGSPASRASPSAPSQRLGPCLVRFSARWHFAGIALVVRHDAFLGRPVRRHVCCDGHFPCTRPSRRHDARGRDTLSRDAGTPPTCPRTIWACPSAAKWPVTQVPTRVSNAKVPPKCSFRQQRRSTTHAVQRWAVVWVWRLSLLLSYARSGGLTLAELGGAVSSRRLGACKAR